MNIDKLIKILEKVKKSRGNVEVVCSAFGDDVGAHYHHSTFAFKPFLNRFSVKNKMNDLNQLCLSIELTEMARNDIVKGKKDMKRLGYRFYPGQFCQLGESPRTENVE
jgi:hypothetical protein